MVRRTGRVEVLLLGAVEARRGEVTVDVGSPQRRAVLALLALRRGETVPVERLIDALWPQNPPDTARHTVQVYVSELRKILGRDVIETATPGYRLVLPVDAVDASRFEQLLREGRRQLTAEDPATAAATLLVALGLWRGPALGGLPEGTTLGSEAARWEELRLEAQEARLDADLATGRHAEAVGELEGLVAEHPYRERFVAQLMVALYRSGRQAEALEVFGRARQRLAEDLGIEPGPGLRGVHEQVLRQDPALRVPGVNRPRVRRLPVPRTSFVGRHMELAETDRLLRRSRLLTLTGPPGVGKTRLAIELSHRVEAEFPDGVAFVPLAPVSDPGGVVGAVGEVLGVRADGDARLQDAVLNRLRDARLLLVLDNLEHLPAAGGDIAAMLDAAADVTVLATSRVPMRLTGEQLYAVEPLEAPASDAPSEAVIASDAVALFEARARLADPGFSVAAGHVEAVAELVRRLAGLPLALELAAARIRLLAPGQLVRRLEEEGNAALAAPLLDVEERHRTMQAAIDWSFALLDGANRTVLGRLAIFSGGLTVEAAEAVVGSDVDVVAALGKLLDASLLQRTVEPGAQRFDLLPPIRERAGELLTASGERDEVTRRHLRFFCEFAVQAAGKLTGPERIGWLDRLACEHDNLRAGLSTSVRQGDAPAALRLASSLWRFWQLRGHLHEGRDWLERALALPGATQPITPRLRALLALAGIRYWQGAMDDADGLYVEARDLARRLDDPEAEAEAIQGLFMTRGYFGGDPEAAASLEADLDALTGDIDDPEVVAGGLATSGLLRLLADDLPGAHTRLTEAERIMAATGNHWGRAQMQLALARVDLRAGDPAAAVGRLHPAAEQFRTAGDLPNVAQTLDWLAVATAQTGDLDRAVTLEAAAANIRQHMGGGPTLADRGITSPSTQAAGTLPEQKITTAWTRGSTLTADQAIALTDPDNHDCRPSAETAPRPS